MTTKIYVRVNEEDQITDIFSAEPDPDMWPGFIEIESDDPRYETYYNGLPDFMRVGMVRPGE
jgi:hypothetical protein